ncbi:MAG: hypothetical protein ABSE62_14410 [Chthoniobacteraceae bacterium]|jgi:hypothetical protein
MKTTEFRAFVLIFAFGIATSLGDVTTPGIYDGVLSVVTAASPQGDSTLNITTRSLQSIRARVTADGKLYILTAGPTADFGSFNRGRMETAQVLTGGTAATFAGGSSTWPAVVTKDTIKFIFSTTLDSGLAFPDDTSPTTVTGTYTFSLRRVGK